MADLITTRIFTDGEKGITATKLNDIVASSTIQPAFVSSKPTASTADPADTMLLLKAAGTYAQVPFSTVVSSVNTQLPSSDSEIWSVRLRSFNSVGNCNFEVDQISVGGGTTVAGQAKVIDRWFCRKNGTMVVGAQQGAAGVLLPGTNFRISNRFLRFTLTTAQASLGTGDYIEFSQMVEGICLRELISDVHSLSVLVRSSVAGLKFNVYLKDPTSVKVLGKLCTIPSANVWTLIQMPNLPVWDAGGAWGTNPGVQGYYLGVCLAAGANQISPAADTWQSGSFLGVPGMSNFAGSATSSTFDIAMVQHEPGAVCSTLQDKTFAQNYDEVQRYWVKSYDLAVAPGTVTGVGAIKATMFAGTNPLLGAVRFPKRMAKAPTLTAYSDATGAINTARDGTAAVDKAVTGTQGLGDSGFFGLVITGPNAGNYACSFQYVADSGW